MTTQEELQRRIRELEKEVAHLHSQIKHQQYGLVWLDVPEAFDKESENKIPILEEVPEMAIHHDDGKPTHILIEGDNYHALTCLNYTHKGKVDVIYIDPPYNTGNDGFVYKDKRLTDRYPDGTNVPTNSPQRHSYWLSFMHRRIELAHNLLSDRGIIVISIDSNEQANLKLLCDSIFGEENFISCLPRITKSSGKTTDKIALNNDYLLLYSRRKENAVIVGLPHDDEGFRYEDEYVRERGRYKLNQTLDYDSLQYSDSLDYPITYGEYTLYPGSSEFDYLQRKKGNHRRADWEWRWSEKKYQFGLDNGFIVLKKSKGGVRLYTKTYQYATIEKIGEDYQLIYKDRTKPITSLDFTQSDFSNDVAKKELGKLFGKNIPFDYPKPTSILSHLMKTIPDVAVVLDFFAGSGTTLHATMNLNTEDGGHRQCILCQINEANICTDVTYERNKRVMNGYTDSKSNHVEGLGNSLKYYRTAFVGKNKPKDATDEDKVTLSKKAGCLLALAENTLYEQKSTDFYQIYSDEQGHTTAIYFQEDGEEYGNFLKEVEGIKGKRTVYVFSWGTGEEFRSDFETMKDVMVKSIPQPILDIYKSLNQ